ncbi:MAG: LruC domain-containing protein [Bacteroidia bacterium]|nr:LruC domain-containing protein [Bacteroidia bacterium]
MNKISFTIFLALIAFQSCKQQVIEKQDTLGTNLSQNPDHRIDEVRVPNGFSWETSRNVKVKITTNDTRFKNELHKIEVYNKKPELGGKKLAEGSVSTDKAFETLILTPFMDKSFYIQKIAPDGSKDFELCAIVGNQALAEIKVDNTQKIVLGKSDGGGNSPIGDMDGDGVADDLDCYPSDPTKAFCNTYGIATLAFEDLWPHKGDYDMNDMVINYSYKVITNATNHVVRVEADYTLRATGGSYNNGFGVEFPISRASINTVQGATLETNQSKAVLIVFQDMRAEMKMWNTIPNAAGSPTVDYQVSFNVSNGPTLAQFGLGAYNPFIWNGSNGFGRGYEVHLPGGMPTDLANTSLLGTGADASQLINGDTYISKNDRSPWAINIPIEFDYPIEKADINTAYTKFSTWVSSGGTQYVDWYTNQNGYRNNSNIY